ncbi:MAG: trehalose-phosphatase [Candidatus Omnitrophica bacterium]|nr:trehalose-phosphatase [Candidatus Omnitrophota bacterium]
MDYFFAQLDKIEKLLSDKFILLLLDFDGTLTPIAKTPQDAVISKETKELLQKLSLASYCKIGIISGRSLEDLKNTVGLKGIIYSGNHGLEIQGPKIRFESRVSPGLKLAIRKIAQGLRKELAGINGALIEDKGLTLSVHYRLVDKQDLPVFKKIIAQVVHPYRAGDKIKIDSGKKVYEIKPPVQWDKGKVVLWLMARQQFSEGEIKVLPVYIGDDATDEDAFKALKRKGLTIVVGNPNNSAADYYLKDAQEVIKFLRLVLREKDK